MVTLHNDWDVLLKEEFEKDYYLQLRQFLIHEYNSKVIHPDKYKIFEALRLTSYENTKVVILGQDPYHGRNQAHGLAFSVQKGIQTPPSLVNIYKELHTDIGCEIPNNGHLVPWAEQGVLLLNTCLTVIENYANSHRNRGWEQFTDSVIKRINDKETPVVFLLWGNNAKAKEPLISNKKHLVLKAPHPSPLSAHAGFFGCKHFSKTNVFLKENGMTAIDWQIPNI